MTLKLAVALRISTAPHPGDLEVSLQFLHETLLHEGTKAGILGPPEVGT